MAPICPPGEALQGNLVLLDLVSSTLKVQLEAPVCPVHDWFLCRHGTKIFFLLTRRGLCGRCVKILTWGMTAALPRQIFVLGCPPPDPAWNPWNRPGTSLELAWTESNLLGVGVQVLVWRWGHTHRGELGSRRSPWIHQYCPPPKP